MAPPQVNQVGVMPEEVWFHVQRCSRSALIACLNMTKPACFLITRAGRVGNLVGEGAFEPPTPCL